MTAHPKTTDAIFGYGIVITELASLNQITSIYNSQVVKLVGLWVIIITFIGYFYFLHKMDRYEEEQATDI